MSKLNDLTAITTPSLSDLVYCVQNSTDYKVTNQQLLDLIKTNTVIPLTQTQYDNLTPAEKNNGSIYIITDGTITADDVEYSSGVSVGDKLDELGTISQGTCTLNTTNVTSGDVKYVKYGRLVIVSGYFLPSNGDNQAVVFTLPYAPLTLINEIAQTDQSPYCIYLAVNANELNVRTGPHVANSYVRFSIVYITAS